MTSLRLVKYVLMSTLNYYLSLPWNVKIHKVKDEDGDYYFGQLQEIPEVRADGDTLEECYNLVMEMLKSNLEIMIEDKEKIPEPVDKTYSGKFNLRLPKSLHKKLAEEAEDEGISLNQLALYKLSV